MYHPCLSSALSGEDVEKVATAIGYKLLELEGDTLAHGLTVEEWRGLARAALATLSKPGEREGEWRDIASAPYDTPVDVRAGRMTFVARLLANHSIDENEQACDQWVAEHEGEHPPCWTDGACWENNSDKMMSIQPEQWRPAAAIREGRE
jgi:hypothetical protein